MNELKKGFYVFDMAVFGFFLFALNHTMFIESWIVEVALDIAVLLRFTVLLLLYKQERLAIIPLVAFVLLYGIAIYEDAFNEIAGEEYEKAIEESKIEVVGKPQIDIVKMEKGQES